MKDVITAIGLFIVFLFIIFGLCWYQAGKKAEFLTERGTTITTSEAFWVNPDVVYIEGMNGNMSVKLND